MKWEAAINSEFEPELFGLQEDVRIEILALTRLLQQFGPHLGRPRVDTRSNSRHSNMKELRFDAADGEWCSPSIRRKELIRKADLRLDIHLEQLKITEKASAKKRE